MREKLLEYCKLYCNNPDLEDEGGFSLVLDQMETIIQQAGVSAESISDLSQSFSGDTAFTVRKLLSPYKRVKML